MPTSEGTMNATWTTVAHTDSDASRKGFPISRYESSAIEEGRRTIGELVASTLGSKVTAIVAQVGRLVQFQEKRIAVSIDHLVNENMIIDIY